MIFATGVVLWLVGYILAAATKQLWRDGNRSALIGALNNAGIIANVLGFGIALGAVLAFLSKFLP